MRRKGQPFIRFVFRMPGLNINFRLFVFLAFVSGLCSAGENCTPEEMARAHLQKLAMANNELAFNLHRSLASESSENIFFSPLSISTVFGMLFYGARNGTAEELRAVLGYKKAEMPDDLVHATFHRFLAQMMRAKDSSDAYVLKSANAVLVEKQLQLEPEYKKEVEELYEASVQDVDFLKSGGVIVDMVNQWVKEKTNGKIDNLLDELDPSTLLVLLNAVYFKGTWRIQFNPEKTRPQMFYNKGLDSETKEVPLMHMSARLLHAWMPEYQALELWYKGENISMLILLPDDKTGLPDLEKSLSQEKLAKIFNELEDKKVILSLPKFKMQYTKELSNEMQELGAEKIFRAGEADFSGMTPNKNLAVSQVLHKAVIEVNEEGSEAASVTGIISNRMRPILDMVPEFRADHPFLFFILERGSGSNLILFMGRVNNL